jgi:hypothetical protein
MSLDTSAISKTFANVLGQIPVTLNWNGTDYDGSKTTVNLDRLYMDAGRLEQYSFSWMGQQGDFSSLPAVDDKVTIGATTYRILGRQTDAADVTVRLDLGPEYAQ